MSSERNARAIAWARARMLECEITQRSSKNQRSRDWAYGEEVALRAMINILEGYTP